MKSLFMSMLAGVTFLAACTTPLVTGRDLEMEPITKTFDAPMVAVFEASEEALKDLKYKVEYADRGEGSLRTGWQPTTANSHYLELFNRRDYGTTGSYYHLAVRIQPDGPSKSTVTVAAPLRSIVVRMKSSHAAEKKFLSKLEDLLRPADIKVTNLGAVKPGTPASAR